MRKLLGRLLRSRLVQVLLVLGVLLGAFGVWVLLHPGSFVVQPWRAQQTTMASRYVFGPYPLQADFPRLKQMGVTTIISLLNPVVPYEKVLLGEERERAKQYGITLRNFPMGSILGQHFGEDYEANSRAAAQAALDSQGVVYIHCYLGLHRAVSVREILNQSVATVHYAGGVQSGRSPDKLLAEAASKALREHRYADALAKLDRIKTPNTGAYVLRGWTNYRLSRIEAAGEAFAKALALTPNDRGAHTGAGFVALRQGDLAHAEGMFLWVLERDDDDADGIEGLAYVRYRQGRAGEARVLLQQVLRNAPGNDTARQMLERLDAAPAAAQ